jgi:tetratricopeptide (TPR) repeat protein
MDRAKEFLDRLAIHYGDQPNVHFLRGFVAEATRDDEAAIEEYNLELKVTQRAAAPMIQLAQLYAASGRSDEAFELARKAVELEPANARSHFALGRVLLAKQKWADSAAEFEKAKALSPEASTVRFQLSRVYRKLGRVQDAQREEAAFEALHKREEGHPAADNPASLAPSQEGRAR